jgi:hypothetical protein
MKRKVLLAVLYSVSASTAFSQTRFPDFRIPCQDIAQKYNGADARSEWINFKNFHGEQQDLEIKLRMSADNCVFNPDTVNVWVEKIGALSIRTSILVAVNPEAVGDGRIEIKEVSSTCESQTYQHIKSVLEADRVEVNHALDSQIREHVKQDFCPVFDEKVKQSVLHVLNAQ